MTEAQLLTISEFKSLPIFDESDEQSTTITYIPNDGRYHSIRECWTLPDVLASLKNPRLVPLGAIRAGIDGKQVVVAYFGVQL